MEAAAAAGWYVRIGVRGVRGMRARVRVGWADPNWAVTQSIFPEDSTSVGAQLLPLYTRVDDP